MLRVILPIVVCSCLVPQTTLAAGDPGTCSENSAGCYRLNSGHFRDANAAYAALHAPADPSHLRAVIEMGGCLSFGTVWYWLDKEHNLADWDNLSLKQRLSTDAWRYDNNGFVINWVQHPLAGAAFYALARSNDIGVLGAASYSFLTSMFWEYVLEFKEKISVNDVLATPGGGIPIGEFGHKLAIYLNSAPTRGNWLLEGIRWALGLPVSAHRALDGKAAPSPEETDSLGLNADIWHHFRFGYRATFALRDSNNSDSNDGSSLHSLHSQGAFIFIPGFLREGRFSRTFFEANHAEMRLTANFSQAGVGWDLFADTTLLGHYTQNIRRYASGLRGYGFLIGTNIAYRYLSQRALYRDRLAILNLPGLSTKYYYRAGRLKLHLAFQLNFDFASAHAATFSRWQAAHPSDTPKTILAKQSYYYGWGGSGRARFELSYRPVALGAHLFMGIYDSDEGLDRTQDEVTNDVKASDFVFEYAGWLHVDLWSDWLKGSLSVTGRRRTSSVSSFDEKLYDDRISLGLICDI